MSDELKLSDLFMTSSKEQSEEVFPGIRRQLVGHDDHLMLVKVWFEEGAIGEVHTHPHSQGSYVLEGEFEVEVDGQKKVLTTGDTFFVPSQAPHGAVCLKPGILLDVFSPARRDFLGLED